MKETEIIVRDGIPEDALNLGRTVTGAIGRELCISMAEGEDRLPLVDRLFAELAFGPESQYSYRNAIVATTDTGRFVGAIIAYDGVRLHELRRTFVVKANEILGWGITPGDEESWGDEADSGEIYIDSLYVEPEFRKSGVATRLIESVIDKYRDTGKPVGLLCEPENTGALRLYTSLGFKPVGVSNFFRTKMNHLQILKD